MISNVDKHFGELHVLPDINSQYARVRSSWYSTMRLW